MMKNYMTFDFGKSYFRDQSVTALVIEKIPVSISLGLWSMLLIYLVDGTAKQVSADLVALKLTECLD